MASSKSGNPDPTEQARADAHRAKIQEEVRREEQEHPLVKSILWLFQEQQRRLTAAEIAVSVGADLITVRRYLHWMDDQNWLECIDDTYYFNTNGFFKMKDHLTYGTSDPLPAPPGPEEIRAFMIEAIRGAEYLERKGHTDDALDRLEEIEDQARENGFEDLAAQAHRLIEDMV